jgi:branched-chain amino acid transport system ATP-binding protein
MLQVKQVSKRFGGLDALKDVNLFVKEGEIFGLIGPNGAGKTTLFNIISGIFHCDRGNIIFQGEDITKYKSHQGCMKGISRTFQLVKPFSNISVLQNVIVGAFCRINSVEKAENEAIEILKFVDLFWKKDVLAKSLTIADRKRLELARALATKPRLLLLDEIMGGLNPKEIEDVITLLRKVQRNGTTLFIIEHVMRAIMVLSEKIAVLDFGEKIAEGTPEEISKNQEVIKAYLGEEYVITRSGTN